MPPKVDEASAPEPNKPSANKKKRGREVQNDGPSEPVRSSVGDAAAPSPDDEQEAHAGLRKGWCLDIHKFMHAASVSRLASPTFDAAVDTVCAGKVAYCNCYPAVQFQRLQEPGHDTSTH